MCRRIWETLAVFGENLGFMCTIHFRNRRKWNLERLTRKSFLGFSESEWPFVLHVWGFSPKGIWGGEDEIFYGFAEDITTFVTSTAYTPGSTERHKEIDAFDKLISDSINWALIILGTCSIISFKSLPSLLLRTIPNSTPETLSANFKVLIVSKYELTFELIWTNMSVFPWPPMG